MTALNFNEPSNGNVSSSQTALTVKNTGSGNALDTESNSEGVHAVSHSSVSAGLAGFNDNTTTNNPVAGVFGKSRRGEGVHGETDSDRFAAVAGIQLNPNSRSAGIFGRGVIAGRFEGDVEVTGDIQLTNGDCAEEFDLSSTEPVGRGTVMILNQSGKLEESYQAYDKKVAGIISGAGDYKPALVLDKKEHNQDIPRLPIALMGKVYCKVDATYSSIEVGDLLTTSDTKGHAMKAADPLKAFGTVIGKALQSLNDGRSLIPVLVALQ